MAKRDSKSQPNVSTTQIKEPQPRYYTVGYAPNQGKPNPSPQLTIKGKWLEDLGFITGQPVIITTEQGCLVIRAELNV